MPNYAELSPEAEALLSEIIEHEETPNYWEKRFDSLSRKEDAILRGCFKELKENGMISTLWASGFPCEIEILKDGYLYDQHQRQQKKVNLSLFEQELEELIERGQRLYIPRFTFPADLNLDRLSFERGVWINDMTIFYEKYLAKHILGNKINDCLHCENSEADVIELIIPYLVSIRKDKEYIKSMQDVYNNKQRTPFVALSDYDVFISHANRDKPDIVEKLYASLKVLGIKIFYDKESLEWGDNWKNRILEGTQKAEFAIIVISENFFDREWTERELSEFLNRQNCNGQRLILPILHNITIGQLKEKYPSVADIQGISTQDYTCDQIALLFARQLIKRLRLAHIQ